jgi:hypothetical protein
MRELSDIKDANQGRSFIISDFERRSHSQTEDNRF